MENHRKITHEGKLNLVGFEIPCYVLGDGTRVLSGRGMQEALCMVDTESGKEYSGAQLPRFLGQKSLEPFIYKEKDPVHYKPLECYKGNQKINGYEATILADICEAILDARDNIELSQRQQIVADQCEILVRAFAKVGIVALVDEATGYQHERENDELQKILAKYISPELLKWQKTFPDEYYKELFRLNGWDYTVKGIRKRPSCIGRWTNKLIYDRLPPGVFDELKKNTPKTASGSRKHKYFQLLTEDTGNPHLTALLNQTMTLFHLSDNMKHMWGQLEKLESRQFGQVEVPFFFDENGHTIAPEEKEEPLSEYNKTLKKTLEYTD